MQGADDVGVGVSWRKRKKFISSIKCINKLQENDKAKQVDKQVDKRKKLIEITKDSIVKLLNDFSKLQSKHDAWDGKEKLEGFPLLYESGQRQMKIFKSFLSDPDEKKIFKHIEKDFSDLHIYRTNNDKLTLIGRAASIVDQIDTLYNTFYNKDVIFQTK